MNPGEAQKWSTKQAMMNPALPRRAEDVVSSGKTRQGKNGLSGFMHNILSSKKKNANLKRGTNLANLRLQSNDASSRKASPHSQPSVSDQSVECMVYYEPHDLNASLSSGSDKGSHAGSGSGSGSGRHVIQRRTTLTNEETTGSPSRYQTGARTLRSVGSPTTNTLTSKPVPGAASMSSAQPSIYAHGDHGSAARDSAYGFLTQTQPSVQSGPAYSNVRPSYRNHSNGNYLPMDQYLCKDSGASSSVSGSLRQEETSLGLEDSGIEIGTTSHHQQAGYASSRGSAYSHDDYLLPLSHRSSATYATEEQLKLQELQLQRQEQQLQELQKQHFQIKQQLQLQHQQPQPVPVNPLNVHPRKNSQDDSISSASTKSGSRVPPQVPAKPNIAGKTTGLSTTAENSKLNNSGHNHSSTSSCLDNVYSSQTNTTNPEGKYGRKFPVKPKSSESQAKPVFNQSSYVAAKQESQALAMSGNRRTAENTTVSHTLKREQRTKPSHYGRKHTFAPQEGYTEVASRSSVRSSRSSSSKGSSSQGKNKPGQDVGRPVAANIILNIPGYRVPGSLGRNKRFSSAEESDMESMTSVSVTSREVANIMTQAMRMQRNSIRRRSKCEHHHRTFATKPGRTANLSRSSNLRGSNSSNRSKGKRACTKCGSQSQKVQQAEKSGESLISFIEQSMRSFLLNSSETVSTEDTSSETKSSSDRNKSPSDGSPTHTTTEDQVQQEPPSNTSSNPAPDQTNRLAPSLFEIVTYCELRTIEIQNDYKNSFGYGMHLQQVNFNPEGLVKAAGKLSSNGVHLGQGSSAFDKFQGKIRLIYCVHMLDKAGVAAKQGALKEGDYLIEVNGVNCLEKSDQALLEVLSQETDSLKLLVARGHHKERQEFFA